MRKIAYRRHFSILFWHRWGQHTLHTALVDLRPQKSIDDIVDETDLFLFTYFATMNRKGHLYVTISCFYIRGHLSSILGWLLVIPKWAWLKNKRLHREVISVFYSDVGQHTLHTGHLEWRPKKCIDDVVDKPDLFLFPYFATTNRKSCL